MANRRRLSTVSPMCTLAFSVMIFSGQWLTTLGAGIVNGLDTGDRHHNSSGFVGGAATLQCDINEEHCGRVYLVTWTKFNQRGQWERVYLFSKSVNRVLGPLADPDRAAFHASNESTHLRIFPLKVTDDGTYKCDVTYVQGECPSLSFTHLQTLIEPQDPVMRLEGRVLDSGSVLGPFIEGQTIVLDCVSLQGRPASMITWRNGTSVLPIKVSSQPHASGLTDVVATARFVVSRWDLGARLDCVVENPASPRKTIVNFVTLDVHVRPSALRLRGPAHPVVAGEMVSLTCVVDGAKPAANITWYNRSELVNPQPIPTEEPLQDGTFRTTSTIVLIATQFDHQSEYFCKGMNQVLKNRTEAPFLQAVRLEVLYPPAVIMRPLEGVNVTEGAVANITCQYNANPPNISEVTWYKNGHVMVIDHRRHDIMHHQVSLFRIRNVTREDQGAYSCHVRNAFGTGNSSNAIQLDVFFQPEVSAWVSPSVVSVDEGPVIFRCDVVVGNPTKLTRVRWLKDGALFMEVDRGQIELTNINKTLTGTYQCLARNEAGWSELSEEPRPLTVMYPPGPSQIRMVSPQDRPTKGDRVELECAVDDVGFPPAHSYIWLHNGMVLNDSSLGSGGAHGDRLLTEPMTVASAGNYSCAAVNQVGRGLQQGLTLHPMVPPAFIKPLARSGGARVMNHSVVYLECVVECVPQCHVWWKRNNRSIHADYGHHLPRHWDREHRDRAELDRIFKVKASPVQSSLRLGHFSAVKSLLYWNLTELADINIDGDTFTCESSGNEAGSGVSSSIRFKLEYAPEAVVLSADEVELLEGHSLVDTITCSAAGNPPPKLVWTLNDRVICSGSNLVLPDPLRREASGNYTCTATNKYGERSASAMVNVLHKPDCVVTKEEDSTGDIVLTCEAIAAPPVLSFSWHHNNKSLSEENLIAGDTRSVLVLQSPDSFGQYSCVATNLIGSSEPCVVRLTRLPSPAGWVNLFLKEENILILTLALAAILVIALMVFVALAFIRKRSEAKPRIHRENARLVLMDETLPHVRADTKSQLLLPDGTPLIFTPQGRATTLPPEMIENPYQNIAECRSTGYDREHPSEASAHGAKIATLRSGMRTVASDENNYALPSEASHQGGCHLLRSRHETKPSLTVNRLHAVSREDFACVPLEDRGTQRRQRTLQPSRAIGRNYATGTLAGAPYYTAAASHTMQGGSRGLLHKIGDI